MKCPNCGAPIGAGQKICEHCGRELQSQQASPTKSIPESEKIEKTTKMFKSIKEAGTSGAVAGITGVMAGLGPATLAMELMARVLKPLEPILKVVGVFFDIIGSQIMKSLMPVLQPLLNMLIRLAPAIEVVGNIIGWLIRFSLLPLATAIYGIGLFIAALIDLFTLGAFGAITNWNNLMLPIIASLAGVPGFAEGGTVPGPSGASRIIEAHGGETVHREGLDYEILTELRKSNAYNKWNYDRKRRQW